MENFSECRSFGRFLLVFPFFLSCNSQMWWRDWDMRLITNAKWYTKDECRRLMRFLIPFFFHQEKPFDAFVSHTLANISQIYILPMTFSHSRVSEWVTEWKLSKRNEEKKNQVYYCIPLRYGMVSSCQQCALLRHDVSIGAFSSIRESDGIST